MTDVGIVYSVAVDAGDDTVCVVKEEQEKPFDAFADGCMNVVADNDALLHNSKAKEEAC